MQAAYHRREDKPVPQVTDLLDKCQEMGLTVIRIWAFFNLPKDTTWKDDKREEWQHVDVDQHGTPKSLEYKPGMYNEDFLWGLDYVIAEAGVRGIKILPVLTNYVWHYGGMRQYV
eukprot:evm.model.scf_1491.6 EVM.evm.TU.scf_1491.6   scf_1491:26753-28269(+)